MEINLEEEFNLRKNKDIKRQIVVEVYNYEDFLNAVGEIKSALDYDNIEYNYRILEGNDLVP